MQKLRARKKDFAILTALIFLMTPITGPLYSAEILNPSQNPVPVRTVAEGAPVTTASDTPHDPDNPLSPSSDENRIPREFEFEAVYTVNGVQQKIKIQRLPGNIVTLSDSGVAGGRVHTMNLMTGDITVGGVVMKPNTKNYPAVLNRCLTVLSRAMNLGTTTVKNFDNLARVFQRMSEQDIFDITGNFTADNYSYVLKITRTKELVVIDDLTPGGALNRRITMNMVTGELTEEALPAARRTIRLNETGYQDLLDAFTELLRDVMDESLNPQTRLGRNKIASIIAVAGFYKEFSISGGSLPENYSVVRLADNVYEIRDGVNAARKFVIDMKSGVIVVSDGPVEFEYYPGDPQHEGLIMEIMAILDRGVDILSEQERLESEYYQIFTEKKISDATVPADRRSVGMIKVVTEADGSQACSVNNAAVACPRDADGRLDLDSLVIRTPNGTIVQDVTRIEVFKDAGGGTVVTKVFGPQKRPDSAYDLAPIKTREVPFVESLNFNNQTGLTMTVKAFDPATMLKPLLDADGNPVMEPVLDEDDNPVLDPNGNPVMIAVMTAMNAADYIQRVLTFAKLRKVTNLVFPHQTLDFPAGSGAENTHLMFNQLEDISIDFQGSRFIFTDIKKAINIGNVTRVVLKNLTIEWKPKMAGLGTIFKETFLDSNGLSSDRVVLVIDPADMPADGSLPTVAGLGSWNDAEDTWEIDGHEGVSRAEDMGLIPVEGQPGKFTAPPKTTYLERFLAQGQESNRVLVRFFNHNVGIIGVGGYNDVQLKGITFHSGPGLAIGASYTGRGLVISNCKVERKNPSDHISLAAGATNTGTRADLIIENNSFDRQGDDAVNVHGLYLRVWDRRQENGKQVLTVGLKLEGQRYVLDEVSEITIFDANGAYQGKVTARVIHVNADGTRIDIELEDPLGIYTPDTSYVVSIKNTPTRFVVRDNVFTRNNGRGILISAANGLVANNFIEKQTFTGIMLQNNFGVYGDGPGAQNIVLSGNTVKNTAQGLRSVDPNQLSMAGINIGTALTDPWKKDFARIQKIKLSNNTVESVGGPGVFIASHAKNVVISGLKTANTNLKDLMGWAIQNGARIIGGVWFAREADKIQIGTRRFRRTARKQLQELLNFKRLLERGMQIWPPVIGGTFS